MSLSLLRKRIFNSIIILVYALLALGLYQLLEGVGRDEEVLFGPLAQSDSLKDKAARLMSWEWLLKENASIFLCNVTWSTSLEHFQFVFAEDFLIVLPSINACLFE